MAGATDGEYAPCPNVKRVRPAGWCRRARDRRMRGSCSLLGYEVVGFRLAETDGPIEPPGRPSRPGGSGRSGHGGQGWRSGKTPSWPPGSGAQSKDCNLSAGVLDLLGSARSALRRDRRGVRSADFESLAAAWLTPHGHGPNFLPERQNSSRPREGDDDPGSARRRASRGARISRGLARPFPDGRARAQDWPARHRRSDRFGATAKVRRARPRSNHARSCSAPGGRR
ncbi:hypothetical protein SAMN07250955_11089 [Arboricoccus pini]|uniref:Uncharacterized protein n=1 Tax=Arboricoccus pini TaxID=1963835 RepID=A0A212RLK9_9PROT|nr:hypothetical protein SAMN07250955_11089 [Arboricoccus pini]